MIDTTDEVRNFEVVVDKDLKVTITEKSNLLFIRYGLLMSFYFFDNGECYVMGYNVLILELVMVDVN